MDISLYYYYYIVLFFTEVKFVHGIVGKYNAAFQKPAWQSSTYAGKHSALAVDGCKGVHECCMHTSNTPITWWAVDLQDNYTISEVSISNVPFCCGERLRNFTIYGSFDSYDPQLATSKAICAYHPDVVAEGETKTILCDTPINARYVIVEKILHGSGHLQYLTICEVEVPVECESGWYGENCRYKCSNNCVHTCNKYSIHGSCDSKCFPGYTEDNCTTECEAGRYGENCKHQCSSHCLETCNKFSTDGSCNYICLPGYIGHNCTKECPPGSYGTKCQFSCFYNCKGPCDITNGACSVGCDDGWTGHLCDVEKPKAAYANWLVALFSISLVLFIVSAILAATGWYFCMKYKGKLSKGKHETSCQSIVASETQQQGRVNISTHSNKGFADDKDVGIDLEGEIYEQPNDVPRDTHQPYQNLQH